MWKYASFACFFKDILCNLSRDLLKYIYCNWDVSTEIIYKYENYYVIPPPQNQESENQLNEPEDYMKTFQWQLLNHQ